MNSPALKLRALEPQDVDAIYLWENDPAIWPYGTTSAPLSRHQIWEYIKNYDADPFSAGQLRLMIEYGGKAAGAIDLYDVDSRNRRAMVGIMVAPKSRHKGIGKEALRLLEKYCTEMLGLHQLGAVTAESNSAARRLFAVAGYEECGLLRHWLRSGAEYIDAIIYQKILTAVN